MLKFYLVTDTHFYAADVLGRTDHMDQKCLNESGAIIDAAFDILASKQDSDIILIAGDLTNNGERPGHERFLEKLKKLKSSGKRIFAITATHDYGLAAVDSEGHSENHDCENRVSREELWDMYYEFGPNEAIAQSERYMSYVVQLAPGYRLLCLNDDGNGKDFCGYDKAQLEWILEQIKSAEQDGEFLFAMTHHPVLPPSPIYPMFSRRDMLGDYENTSRILADAGLRFVFTGHTHMQNIEYLTTPSGNKLWDINTGSLVGYPMPIRSVVIDDDFMTVSTEHVESFDWDFGGKSVQEYMTEHFDLMLNTIFDSMAFDIDKLADMSGSFSMNRKTVYRLKVPLTMLGKALQKFTLGKAAKLLLCKKKIDSSVSDLLLKDLIIEFIRNIYTGDEPYSKDTPVGSAMLTLCSRIAPLLKPVLKKTPITDLTSFVGSLIYDPTPDSEAVIPLKD